MERGKGKHKRSRENDAKEAPAQEPLNPVFTNSTASLRPLANVRSPLFSRRPLISGDDPDDHGAVFGSPTRKFHETDELLQNLYKSLGNQTNTSLANAVQTSNAIAKRLGELGKAPNYVAYYALLEQLSALSMLEECWQVIQDMEAAGRPPTLTGLNWVLKAAVGIADYAAIERVTDMINNLPPTAAPRTDLKTEDAYGNPQPLAPGISINVKNFNTMTYTQLFRHFKQESKPEQALLLFSAMLASCSSPIVAFTTVFKGQAAEYLISVLCRTREYRLAVEIADWLHFEGVGRLMQPDTWMIVARSCAEGDYYPGVKLAWERTVVGTGVVADEGFVVLALNCAAKAGDSRLCFDIIQHFLKFSSNWVVDLRAGRAEDAAPPLQHIHLVPLLEALVAEGKYREMTRVAGAMAHWGIALDQHCFDHLTERASQSPDDLAKAISDWQRVVDEGGEMDRPQIGGVQKEIRKMSSDERERVIEKAALGQIASLGGAVEIQTMNALIKAAAYLGNEEEALNIWQERKYVKVREPPMTMSGPPQHNQKSSADPGRAASVDNSTPANPSDEYTPISPTAETFNYLILAAINRKPPNPNLAASVYREMRKSFPSVLPNPETFEYLIAINLLTPEEVSKFDTRQNIRLLFRHEPDTEYTPPARNSVSRAFEYLEECKEMGLTPSNSSYEMLIRVSLRRPFDVRWIALVKEMVEEAGHTVTKTLSAFIRTVEGSRRAGGQLKEYPDIWDTYVRGQRQDVEWHNGRRFN